VTDSIYSRLGQPWVYGVAAFLLWHSSLASATSVFHVPLPQMTRESDLVVYAQVQKQSQKWSEGHRRILTLTRIKVLESIKGAKKGDILTIYQVGGSLDGVTYKIPGALVFTPGERMVFFGSPLKNQWVSYGMGLGKFGVFERGGNFFVRPEFGDVNFVRREGQQLVSTAPPETGEQKLTAFMQTLRRFNQPLLQPKAKP
jgi:hypothetical protein